MVFFCSHHQVPTYKVAATASIFHHFPMSLPSGNTPIRTLISKPSILAAQRAVSNGCYIFRIWKTIKFSIYILRIIWYLYVIKLHLIFIITDFADYHWLSMSFYRWWSCILTHRWNWRFVTLATPAFVPVLHEVRTDVDHNLCNLPCQWKTDLRWMLNRRKPSFFLGYRQVLLSFELIHSRKGRTPELWKRNVAMNVQHLDILPTVLKHDFFHCNVTLLDRNWPFIAAVCWTRLRITGETYFYIGHKDIKDPTIARIRRSTR